MQLRAHQRCLCSSLYLQLELRRALARFITNSKKNDPARVIEVFIPFISVDNRFIFTGRAQPELNWSLIVRVPLNAILSRADGLRAINSHRFIFDHVAFWQGHLNILTQDHHQSCTRVDVFGVLSFF